MRKVYVWLGRVLYIPLLPLVRPFIRNSNRSYIALICGGELLLVKNWLARGTWRFPGGGQHGDESPRTAAAREVGEELGIHIDEQQLILVTSGKQHTDRLGYNYTYFAYCLDSKPLITCDTREITDYGFFALPPSGIQQEVLDVIDLLRRKRLL